MPNINWTFRGSTAPRPSASGRRGGVPPTTNRRATDGGQGAGSRRRWYTSYGLGASTQPRAGSRTGTGQNTSRNPVKPYAGSYDGNTDQNPDYTYSDTPQARYSDAWFTANGTPIRNGLAGAEGWEVPTRRRYTEEYWADVDRRTYGGGGGGGGGYVPPVEEPITWRETYKTGGAPSWWKGMTPSRLTAETEYAALVNSMIPYLSPEDQRAAASNLSRLFGGPEGPAPFVGYSPDTNTGFPATPWKVDTATQDQFTSRARAEEMLKNLSRMASSMGKSSKDFGPGYKYVAQLAAAARDFGASTPGFHQTRRQALNFMGAIDPLLNEANGEAMGAYGPLAQMMARPYFSAGALVPVSKGEDGKYIFGQANKGWY